MRRATATETISPQGLSLSCIRALQNQHRIAAGRWHHDLKLSCSSCSYYDGINKEKWPSYEAIMQYNDRVATDTATVCALLALGYRRAPGARSLGREDL